MPTKDCAQACCTCRLTLRKKTLACELLLKATNARNTASHVNTSTKREAFTPVLNLTACACLDCKPACVRAGLCRGRLARGKLFFFTGMRLNVFKLQPRTEDPKTGKLHSMYVQLSACLPANFLWLLPTASITPPRHLNSCFMSMSLCSSS